MTSRVVKSAIEAGWALNCSSAPPQPAHCQPGNIIDQSDGGEQDENDIPLDSGVYA